MTIEIGDRVYHTGLRANGFVREIDEEKSRDHLVVQFFWAKYCDVPHGSWRGTRRPERKWVYTRERSLVKMGNEIEPGINTVGLVGNRSLEALIRNVTEIPRFNGRQDIAIRYGQYRHPRASLVINQYLVTNKYTQCQEMGDIAPDVMLEDPNEDRGWISKPFYSMGGEGIYHLEDDSDYDMSTHYAQRFFPKTREFRAHVFLWCDPQVLLIQEKIIADESNLPFEPLCWNKKQGGEFKYVWQYNHPPKEIWGRLDFTTRERISDLAVLACKRLTCDMGGVDIGLDSDNNLKVFEVNGRMGLREQTLFSYKSAFHKLKHINMEDYINDRWT